MAFGKTGLVLDLPNGFQYRVLEAHAAQPLQDALQTLEEALDYPISCAGLVELARGKRSAAMMCQ